jgi:hypothetical protein
MTQGTVVLYVATYSSEDVAGDDLACVRRLQRDGVLAVDDSTVIARDAAGDWSVRRDARSRNDAPAQGRQTIDWMLRALFPLRQQPTAGDEGGSDVRQAAATWMLDDEVRELREHLEQETAAVLVVGAAKTGPVLAVALARASNMLARDLTAAGTRLVYELPTTVGAGA